MAADTWTEDRVETLKTLWASGLSGLQCGKAMGLSRNSIIGKVSRLGINVRDLGAIERPKKSEKKAPAPARRTMPFKPAKQYFERPQPIVEGLPVTGRVTLVDLRFHHCRFPINDGGDEGFLFCGNDRSGVRPYCAFHSSIAYYKRSSKDA